MSRGTCLEIRPQALLHNASLARRHAPDARLYAMVKANGYGHDIGLVAGSLASRVDGFGVALLEEANTLRQQGCEAPIMLLEGFFDATELVHARRLKLEVVIHSLWQIELLEQDRAATPLQIWLKVNTGMHRLGVPADQVEECLARLHKLAGVEVSGLMSHFACADLQDDPLSDAQLARVVAMAEAAALPFSAANSAALLRYPDSHGALVRPGIMLYGSSPLPDKSAAEIGLQVSQRLSARLIAINSVPAGESVGYGARWRATRDRRIGVVSIGYGDGYPRHAPDGTPVAVNGQRTLLAGRVSMDMLTIDLTDLPDADIGDEVELWGDVVDVDEVARLCGTISYELFCQLTERVVRKVGRRTSDV